jgi:deoxyribose-phosphate aldolase
MTPAEIARLIDHTLLRPDATSRDIESLCAEATEHQFAAVCVNPTWVQHSRDRLAGSQTAVCTVVGFPLGATTTSVKSYEARAAIADGAAEIDVVIDIGRLKSGDAASVRRDLDAVLLACREGHAICKAIIEAALLTDDEKAEACRIAMAAGADYVKTSTGFGPGGATVADVQLMSRVVGGKLGIKAAGRIRDLAAVERFVAAGATRIGTSAGVAIMREARGRVEATPKRKGTP